MILNLNGEVIIMDSTTKNMHDSKIEISFSYNSNHLKSDKSHQSITDKEHNEESK